MASVKQHLQTHHAKSAAHDAQVGGELDKLKKVFESLETRTDGDDDLKCIYSDAKESIGRLAAAFNWHAEYHRSMSASVAKSNDIDDLDKLQPSNISGVVDQSKAPAGARLVPRSGQRIPDDMPKVDQQFEHLVKVDE